MRYKKIQGLNGHLKALQVFIKNNYIIQYLFLKVNNFLNLI